MSPHSPQDAHASAQQAHRKRVPVSRPIIEPRRCSSCRRRVGAGRPQRLSQEVERCETSAVLRGAEPGMGCGACAVACPSHAFALRRPAPAH